MITELSRRHVLGYYLIPKNYQPTLRSSPGNGLLPVQVIHTLCKPWHRQHPGVEPGRIGS